MAKKTSLAFYKTSRYYRTGGLTNILVATRISIRTKLPQMNTSIDSVIVKLLIVQVA